MSTIHCELGPHADAATVLEVSKALAALGGIRRMGLDASEGHHLRLGLFANLPGVQGMAWVDW